MVRFHEASPIGAIQLLIALGTTQAVNVKGEALHDKLFSGVHGFAALSAPVSN